MEDQMPDAVERDVEKAEKSVKNTDLDQGGRAERRTA